MAKVAENKSKRFDEVVHALLKQPLGQELVHILKDRLINNQHVFGPVTPHDHDKFYLGRLSVYKDLIRIAENDPNSKEKEPTNE